MAGFGADLIGIFFLGVLGSFAGWAYKLKVVQKVGSFFLICEFVHLTNGSWAPLMYQVLC